MTAIVAELKRATCSLLMRKRALPVAGFFKILKSPLPLSFHSFVSWTYLRKDKIYGK